jgi:hypothetical protein
MLFRAAAVVTVGLLFASCVARWGMPESAQSSSGVKFLSTPEKSTRVGLADNLDYVNSAPPLVRSSSIFRTSMRSGSLSAPASLPQNSQLTGR